MRAGISLLLAGGLWFGGLRRKRASVSPIFPRLLAGLGFVILGLGLFLIGLEMALFPLGEEMAYSFVRKGNLWLLLLFAFTLGFGTTVAEPALIAIAKEAAQIAAAGDVIAAAISSGANNIYGISFSLDDPSQVESEAREKAVANAEAKADPAFDEAARAMFRKQEEQDDGAGTAEDHPSETVA